MKCKQLLAIIILLCATSTHVDAKVFGKWDSENRQSLSFSVGLAPCLFQMYTSQFTAMESMRLSESIPHYNDYTETDVRNTPIFAANYFYRLNRSFSVGLIAGYGYEALDHTSDESGEFAFTTTNHAFLFTPTVRLHWLNTKYVDMYSALSIIGFGVAISKNAERTVGNTALLYENAFQITPLALSVKLNRTYIFSEVGLGTQGILRFGVGRRF